MENFNKDLDQDTANLFEWLEKQDYDTSKIVNNLKMVVSKNKDEGRCCISTKTFKPDTTLVEMPDRFLINYRMPLKNSDLVEFFEWCLYECSFYSLTRLDALFLYLILEKSIPNSDLSYFIKTIPLCYDTPEYFSSDLIDIFPHYIKHDIIDRINNLENKFQHLSNLINQFYFRNNSNKSVEILKENFSLDLLKWAFCSVNSRCFHIKEEEICNQEEKVLINRLFGNFNSNFAGNYEEKIKKMEEMRNSYCCLIPFMDFLNHSFDSNAYAYYDNEKKAYILKSQQIDDEIDNDDTEKLFGNNLNEKSLDLSSTRVIKENNQIYITYGFHDNKTLLIEYGFIVENNIYDKIVFKKFDFELFLHNKNHIKILWKKANEQNLLDDLSCNSSEGPAWFLTKLIDLIIDINSLNDSLDENSELFSSYEIKNPNEIRLIYIELINKYKNDLTKSLENIKKLNIRNYQINCSLKLFELHLKIVNFNLNLANDYEKWMLMF